MMEKFGPLREITRSPQQEAAGVPAEVVEVLPGHLFRVRLEDNRTLLAHAAGRMRVAITRILAGDKLLVQISPLDPTKARIVALA